MQNKQLRDRIEQVSRAIKGLKAHQIEEQLEISKNIVDSIIGTNQIYNIRSSTLLKLLTYELIIYIDQKNHQSQNSSSRASNEYSRVSERSSTAASTLKQLKSLLGSLGGRKSLKMMQIKMGWSQFQEIMEKVRVIEQQLSREENRKKTVGYADDDEDGNELIIEQLESLLKKKQGRIKQLNEELQQNFFDKQELEEEIQQFEQKNYEMQQLLKRIKEENKQLRQEYELQKQAFEKYKTQQKEDLLFGASQFMNLTLQHKQIEPISNMQQETQSNTSYLSQSTRLLSRYCSNTEQKKQTKNAAIQKEIQQQRTVKKPALMMQYSEIQQAQEQNLLQSVRIINKPQFFAVQNNDNSLQRMLMMQAIFIEQAIDNILA